MPLRLASAGSRGSKFKNIILRICSFVVCFIAVLTCVVPIFYSYAYNESLSNDILEVYYGNEDGIGGFSGGITPEEVYKGNYIPNGTLGGASADNGVANMATVCETYYKSLGRDLSVDDFSSEALDCLFAMFLSAEQNHALPAEQDQSVLYTYLAGYFGDNFYTKGDANCLWNSYTNWSGKTTGNSETGEQNTEISQGDFASSEQLSNILPGTYYGIIVKVYGYGMSDINQIIEYGADFDFKFTSGTTLKEIVDDTDKAFKALLVGAVASSYAGAMKAITESTEKTAALLTDALNGGYKRVDDNFAFGEELYTYDNSRSYQEHIIYNTAYDISSNVMLPIAGVILAFIFAYQIYEAVAERNNLNDMGGGYFIQLILRMIILTAIVLFAWQLTEWFFSLGRWIVEQTTVVVAESSDSAGIMASVTDYANKTDYSVDEILTWVMAYKICVNDAIDFGGTLVMLVQGVIINVGMYIVSLIVYVIVYVRLVEIYLYCCISPIPLATMGSPTWRNTGINFVRSVFALALQGFIIYLCLSIFNIMASETIEKGLSGSSFTGAMWEVIAYSLVLVFCMFKSSSISKSIVDAM